MKTLSIAFAIILLTNSVYGQNQRADSLLAVSKKHTRDTTGVRALLWLGIDASSTDLQDAKKYFKQALGLSEQIKSDEFTAESYIELGRLYHTDGLSDSSLFFHRRALSIAPSNSVFVVDAYQGLALNQLWLSQYDSSRLNLMNALRVAQELNDVELKAGVHNDLGNLALQERNDLLAIEEYLAAAKLYESIHESVGYARAFLNIANIQYRLKHYDKALKYANEGQQIAANSHYDKGVVYASQLKGRIYRAQNKFDEALIEFITAMNGYRKLGDKRSAAETELSVGNVYFDKKNFDQAEVHYQNALSESKEISNQPIQVYSYSSLGYVSYEKKEYKEAIVYTDSSRTMAQAIDDQYSVLDAYNMLRISHEMLGQYKDALHYSTLRNQLSDSLTQAENHAAIEELEVKYQNEKKITEIELLKSDQSRQRIVQYATIVVLMLVIVVALVLVNRYRVVNKVKRQVEIERVRNNIARDLHDDIGSTLSSINILSQVALVEKNGNVDSYLQRINDQSTRMMEDIGDIVWSINPHNDSMKKVITRMREFSGEIFDPKSMSWNFSEKIPEDVVLDAEKRKNLFLIFKETINNAAKYSRAGQVDISLFHENQRLVLRVTDNGQGFDKETAKAGNGLRNIHERAREVNGEVKIISTPGKGTEIEFSLPLA